VKSIALVLRFSPDHTPEDRDLASAALLEFDTAAIHEVSDTEWRAFFRTAEERDRAMGALRAYCESAPLDVEYVDWARKSQENLRAITVGNLIVAPPWDVPGEAPRPIVIVIEPSMGFGTAHHATTRLCLRALQELDLRGRRVLDVGTGSGVLAIASAKLGASSVTAIDNDPDALAAARDNVARNGVAVDLREFDLHKDRLPAADVVLANLTGAMLQRGAPELAALARGGTLILSGLLVEEADRVRDAFAPFSSSIGQQDEDGWSSLTCTIP
jgi:ribosomal protein L11 methyltransferase